MRKANIQKKGSKLFRKIKKALTRGVKGRYDLRFDKETKRVYLSRAHFPIRRIPRL